MSRILLSLVAVIYLSPIFSQTKIIAHRGFSSIAPENTLIAFQKAIESGVDYLELDVHKTKDDSIVVIHDATVDKTSSNSTTGEIADMTYSELEAVRVGYSSKFGEAFRNEKIPTLREALTLTKGKIKVCIEIKVYGIEKEVLEIVDNLGLSEQVIIFSFYYPVLAKVRQLDQHIAILFLINEANKLTIDYAKLIGSSAIGVGNRTVVTRELLDFAHDHDIEVWKWTVNEENEMYKLIELGLDGLITDYPAKAFKMSK